MSKKLTLTGKDTQYKLSLWLKGVDAVLIAFCIAIFVVFMWYGKHGNGPTAANLSAYSLFPAVTAICVLVMLLIFWQVATEIGRDNSFSLENVKHFKHIGYGSGVASIGYILRLIYIIATGQCTLYRACYCMGMMIFGGLVLSVCIILSCLIRNAYEMKQENDLTI